MKDAGASNDDFEEIPAADYAAWFTHDSSGDQTDPSCSTTEYFIVQKSSSGEWERLSAPHDLIADADKTITGPLKIKKDGSVKNA